MNTERTERVESSDPWVIVHRKQGTVAGLRIELMETEKVLRETRAKLRNARSMQFLLGCVIGLLFLGDLTIIFTPWLVRVLER